MIPYIILASLLLIVVIGGAIYLTYRADRNYKKEKEAYRLAQKEKEEQSRLFWEEFEANKQEEIRKEDDFFKEQTEKYDAIFGSDNSIECSVEGIFARSKQAREEVRLLKKGNPIILKQEPTNSYDDYAVKVFSDRMHIGYIPREYSELVFKGIEGKGNYKAIVSYQNTEYDTYYDKDETTLFIKIYLKNIISEN